MTGVITDACIKCKHMDCVEVCPVDAFYEGEAMLVINPHECVDCGCCIEACPVDAIVFDTEPRAAPWLELNATYSEIWPNVTVKAGQTPVDAAAFHHVSDKYPRYFSANPGPGDPADRVAALRAACGHCRRETLLNRWRKAVLRLFGSKS
ncbi:ferredoxin [Sphingomonas trueperi]